MKKRSSGFMRGSYMLFSVGMDFLVFERTDTACAMGDIRLIIKSRAFYIGTGRGRKGVRKL